MSVVAAGFIPAAPLLIPDLCGDAVERDADLRDRVRAVVAAVAAAGSAVIVIGLANEASTYSGTWDFSSLGMPIRGAGTGTLPISLGIGAWFLDDVGYAGPREYVGIPDRAPAAACVALGASLARDRDVALLVVGDGSARRDEKAPGWLDPRAADFDKDVADALATGDPGALRELPQEMATELLAAGRAPWQVAAGATQGRSWRASQVVTDARYGVGYVTAVWLPHLDSNQEPLD